jgi:hypothetical protein
MNTHPSPCDPWHEPISLLAAGCLPAAEQAAVRGHLKGCRACAERFAELSAVCASLDRSRPAVAAAFHERLHSLPITALPRAMPNRTRSLAFPLAGVVAASLLVAAWWMTDRQELPGPVDPLPRPHLLAYQLACAETDAAFDELLRRHHGSTTFEQYGSQSCPRDLLKEFSE